MEIGTKGNIQRSIKRSERNVYVSGLYVNVSSSSYFTLLMSLLLLFDRYEDLSTFLTICICILHIHMHFLPDLLISALSTHQDYARTL